MDNDLRTTLAEAEDRHWWFEGRRRIIASVLRRKGVRGPILEVGCGNGANLAMLSAFGDVTGVEPDPSDRARAASRNIGTVLEGLLPDGLPRAVTDRRFAAVLALDVIEHIEDDVASVTALAERLAPGGVLLITVPANPWMWSRHDTRNGHVRRYTARGLKKTLLAAGLPDPRIGHFNTLLFPAVAAVRVLGRWVGADAAGTDVPPRPINGVLTQLMGLESRLMAFGNLPLGVSLLAEFRAPPD